MKIATPAGMGMTIPIAANSGLETDMLSRLFRYPLLTALALVAATPALAQDKGVVFVGGTVGEDSPSVYIGAVTALPGSALGRGLAVRTVVGRSEYRYDAGAATIEGRANSITVSALHQWSGEWGYANAAAGVAYHRTRLTPDDPNNRNRGSRWNAVVGLDGVYRFGPWQLGGLGSYGFDIKEYQIRGDLTHAVSGKLRLGAEATAQGDPSYERQLYGAVAIIAPGPKWELRVAGGGMFEESRNGPYAALSVSRVF